MSPSGRLFAFIAAALLLPRGATLYGTRARRVVSTALSGARAAVATTLPSSAAAALSARPPRAALASVVLGSAAGGLGAGSGAKVSRVAAGVWSQGRVAQSSLGRHDGGGLVAVANAAAKIMCAI